MPIDVSFKVEGLYQINQALKELGSRAANRVARSAVNKGANPILQRARSASGSL